MPTDRSVDERVLSEADVPLHRVLPLVGRNPQLAAHRVVAGRLRFLLRAGLRIYVPREDYLELCEAAWDKHVRRLGGGSTQRHPADRPQAQGHVEPQNGNPKPIHDGIPLDRYRRSPVLRLAQALGRWLRRR